MPIIPERCKQALAFGIREKEEPSQLMVFHSYIFAFVFLPLTFLGFSLLHKSLTWQNLLLLLASYIFYSWGFPAIFLFFLMYSSFLDYFVGRWMEKTETPWKRKGLLLISIAGNLGLLCTFKYGNWILGSFNHLIFDMGLNFRIPAPDLPLPPGISFYTFQTMSYTIDVYRKHIKAEKRIIPYLTYVSLFSQLVAGPIERSENLLRQLRQPRPPASFAQIENATFLICWGLFKKVVLSDNLGHVVDQSMNRLTEVPGTALIAIFAFSCQIYCDFSAYTDIARGSAKLFNIEIMRNFKTPYFSRSPSDFWKRWHISLSQWLRDYLYIPLGGNRVSGFRHLINLMLVMTLGGFWHGAGAFFVLWGVYHGALLVLYYLVPIDRILEKTFGALGRAMAIGLMYLLTCFGWALFISSPSSRFPAMMHNLAWFLQAPPVPGFYFWLYPALLFGIPVFWTEYAGYRKGGEFVDLYEGCPWYWKTLWYVVMFYGICLLGRRISYDFIYFQF